MATLPLRQEVYLQVKRLARTPSQWSHPLWCYLLMLALWGLLSQGIPSTTPLIVSALFIQTLLLLLPTLFEEDIQSGLLQQFSMQGERLQRLLMIRLCLSIGMLALLFIVALPVIHLFLGLPWKHCLALLNAWCAALPILVSLGSIAQLMLLEVQGGGWLFSIMVWPLYLPLLLLIVQATILSSPYYLLIGLSLFSLSITPFLMCWLVLVISWL